MVRVRVSICAQPMNDSYVVLLSTAATLGVVHTALGVDHVVPFVALAHARNWSLLRTMVITAVCGLGHVMSSVIIASVGLTLGIATGKLAWIEATRGSWAAMLLIGFGLGYAGFAYWKSRRRVLGTRLAQHEHGAEVAELIADPMLDHWRVMPALFIIFVLGPCEALLPLLTASGLTLSLAQSTAVGGLFCGATLLTMISLVAVGYWGVRLSGLMGRHAWLHRYAHTWAGLSMAMSGVAIQVLEI